MLWFIIIIVVLIAVFSLSGASKRSKEVQEQVEFNALLQSRVAAYADYLRRTPQHSGIANMTDN